MKLVSRLAMAAALTLGGATLVATPAAAQKNKKEDKANSPQVSEEFRKAAGAGEVAMAAAKAATDPAVKNAKIQEAATSQVAAEALAKTEDEKYYAAALKFEVSKAKNDEAGLIAAIGVLSVNPRTPPEQQKQFGAIYNYRMGAAAANAKKYPEAIQSLTKARELGSTEPDLPVLLANAYSATGKDAEAVAEVDSAIKASKAEGKKPSRDWYKFAISRVYKSGDRAAVASWLTRYIQDYPTSQDWRWMIQVYMQGPSTGNAKLEKLDLYRLMRSTNALADQRDYGDYAYQAKQAGMPWEAVAVIEEGRAKGKVPSTDPDTREILTSSQAAVKTAGSIDAEAAKAKNGTAKDLWYPAEAYLASGKYEQALGLYDLALQKGGLPADEVNMHRGIALARLGRKEEAKAAFGTIKTGSYANLALLWATSVDFPPLS